MKHLITRSVHFLDCIKSKIIPDAYECDCTLECMKLVNNSRITKTKTMNSCCILELATAEMNPID